ncbi:MAG: SGNH/GDSL hydrolase family protein [Microcoleaceae cyanobacterium MO_207.B10]|nr:SGNH/GDSL hydrolase family protein [Microcoleaceae cyanobacterium MO_207.B10]
MNYIVSATIAVTASLGSIPAYAATFNPQDSSFNLSQMFVFGDSLSDPGNAFYLTRGLFPDGSTSLHFQGRFSNGPIWIESLASFLDLNPTAFYANFSESADGANYAVSGSLSGDENIVSFLGLSIGLQQQLETFIYPLLTTNQSANSDALYTVFTGANDYLIYPLSLLDLAIEPETPPNPNQTVNNISNAIESLYNVGARDFLIPNLPALGQTPLATFTGTSDWLNELTDAHNQKLELAIAELNQSLSGAKITLLDINSILDGIIENPAQFGFSNFTGSWSNTVKYFCPDAFLATDGSVASCDVDVPDPDEYVFWDILHPTAAGHQIFADAAINTLQSEYKTVPEYTSILTFLGLGVSLLAISPFKQKQKV